DDVFVPEQCVSLALAVVHFHMTEAQRALSEESAPVQRSLGDLEGHEPGQVKKIIKVSALQVASASPDPCVYVTVEIADQSRKDWHLRGSLATMQERLHSKSWIFDYEPIQCTIFAARRALSSGNLVASIVDTDGTIVTVPKHYWNAGDAADVLFKGRP